MSHILVTGGLGVVGTPLVAELRRRGHRVHVCDLGHHHDNDYLRCDVAEFMEVLQLFAEIGHVDYVYHLAAEFGRHNGEDFNARMWRSNAVGTKNILRMQELQGFKLVFFSSSEVYGDWQDTMSESVLMKHPIRQLNDYAISKWVNEQQVMNSAELHDTETVRVRLFNTYGPGEYYSPYRSVCCKFCYCALHDLPYTVYTEHQRSSTYIDDTVQTLANISDEGRFKPGAVYNIGSETTHNIKDVSTIVLNILGKDDSCVTYEEIDKHNTLVKIPDMTLAKRDLGHKNTVELFEGLKRTIEWMKKVYKV